MSAPKCPSCEFRGVKVGGGRGWWWCDFCRHHFQTKESPKPPRRDRRAVESMLRNTGALKIERLVEHGFRKGDITRWLRTKVLYRPYGRKAPDVVMVKR